MDGYQVKNILMANWKKESLPYGETENNLKHDGWLLKSRWMASETRCATHWNKMMAYWHEMTHWEKMDRIPPKQEIVYLSTETWNKHTKTRWMPNRNYCRQMVYALKNEGNKLKQTGRKLKQDEIRLSREFILQRGMSELRRNQVGSKTNWKNVPDRTIAEHWPTNTMQIFSNSTGSEKSQ